MPKTAAYMRVRDKKQANVVTLLSIRPAFSHKNDVSEMEWGITTFACAREEDCICMEIWREFFCVMYVILH